MTHRSIRRAVALGIAALVALAVGAGPAAALHAVLAADTPAVAWSVMPSDAQGVPDGRSRFELEPQAGHAVTDYVLVSNASTVEQAFDVYAADALNTASGGYDLQPHTALPVDVATWVTVDPPVLTLPALGNAVVAFTVVVPDGAQPGDHVGGIVVSPTTARPDESGVLVDTRVAVRLNVRVPGELTPALTVQNVTAHYSSSWVPFASGKVTVSYDVQNTGNVKIIGQPRVRLTGPTGAVLGRQPADEASSDTAMTGEVLPGQGFTATAVFEHVPPHFAEKAVVDLDMVAAPGPQTEIPLVSSTASSSFAAVPWTGLALIVAVIVLGLAAYQRWRWYRSERERLWREFAERDDVEGAGASAGPATGGALTLLVALGLGGALVLPTFVVATAGPAAADPSDGDATVVLTVPPPPTTVPATTLPGTTTPPAAPPSVGPILPTTPAEPTGEPTQSGTVVAPTGSTDAGPDLTWNQRGGMTGPQTALVALAGGGALAASAVGVRRYLRLRAARAVA